MAVIAGSRYRGKMQEGGWRVQMRSANQRAASDEAFPNNFPVGGFNVEVNRVFYLHMLWPSACR